jgi:DNA replication protein DnaC
LTLNDEATGRLHKVPVRHLLIVDEMGMKNLAQQRGEILFGIIMRRFETRSTMMAPVRRCSGYEYRPRPMLAC